jgi:hypothetical protein
LGRACGRLTTWTRKPIYPGIWIPSVPSLEHISRCIYPNETSIEATCSDIDSSQHILTLYKANNVRSSRCTEFSFRKSMLRVLCGYTRIESLASSRGGSCVFTPPRNLRYFLHMRPQLRRVKSVIPLCVICFRSAKQFFRPVYFVPGSFTCLVPRSWAPFNLYRRGRR